MRQTDDRPAAGAAAAATGGAAVEGAGEVAAALDLVEQGLGRLAAVDASSLPEGCVTDTVRRLGALVGRVDGIQARFPRPTRGTTRPRAAPAQPLTTHTQPTRSTCPQPRAVEHAQAAPAVAVVK